MKSVELPEFESRLGAMLPRFKESLRRGVTVALASAGGLHHGAHATPAPLSPALFAAGLSTDGLDETGGWGMALVALAGAVLVILVVSRFVRSQSAAHFDAEVAQGEEDDNLEREYPYCTMPPEPEPLVLDLSEPIELTPALLRQLEWKRFQELVCSWYRESDIDAQPSASRGAGGVDICLYRKGEHRPFAYAQCRSWLDCEAALVALRELAFAMESDGVAKGVAVSAGEFDQTIRTFAASQSIELVDGREFATRFGELKIEARDRILRQVTRDDFRSPTCPRCSAKMRLQRRGADRLWICSNAPRCSRTLTVGKG